MNEQRTQLSQLMTIDDVAKHLQKSTRTIYRMVALGLFPKPPNIKGRGWLWHPSVIERWAMDERHVEQMELSAPVRVCGGKRV